MKLIITFFLCFNFWLISVLGAQTEKSIKVSLNEQMNHHNELNSRQIALALADSLMKSYIIEDKAREMAEMLRFNSINGDYDKFINGLELATHINKELFKISNDLHLSLLYFDSPVEPVLGRNPNNEEESKQLMDFLNENQHGILSKSILEGNIGYLALSFFGPMLYCEDKLVSAMKYVEGTNGLIIDLRRNSGSLDPDTVPFFMSYFFDSPVHIFSFENREKKSERKMWTRAEMSGNRYLNKPVYILTSAQTFSGAEEFAYDMKHHDKATIIGERTKGGANPTSGVRINNHFIVVMPKERSVNTITKTNWDQVGVIPDIDIDANLALYQAHRLILKDFYTKASALNPAEIENKINGLGIQKPKFRSTEFELKGYLEADLVYLVGNFNYWNATKHPLKRNENGWSIETEVLIGEIEYKFVVDGEWILDPNNPNTKGKNEHINSVKIILE
ncbi:S41 family peptidase [Sabulilitoribacter multivorans]|uniref:S41 family peptidase n=1 Tax=Flaviramulus multivorans TaxID=1304750 RepID=A0ABS9IER9_9FLAO|nr:S41 family peptidase [Flaviramulus multivorans]MCF7559008.1 S41 family peptidase [Flaviramulus multivorans]